MGKGIGDLLFQTTPNKDIKVAANLVKDLLKNAKKDVKLVSGALPHNFYIKYGIDKVLKKISSNVDIEIISGNDYDKKSNSIFELAKANKIKLYLYKGDPPKHFLLVDGKNVRAEIFHKARELDILKTKGNVVKNSLYLGNKLKLDFDEFKRESSAYATC